MAILGRCKNVIMFVLISGFVIISLGKDTFFDRELAAKAGYVSAAANEYDKVFILNSVGIEYFKRLSNEYGDFLTQDVQLRFTWDWREEPKDAWAIEIHNAWAEFRFGLGKSLRIGHFQPMFGLEPITDTHGSLFQTLAMQNMGMKHDWGAGFKGFVGPFDYRIGAQMGHGMTFQRYKNNYLFTTRFNTPERHSVDFALSGLVGNVYTMGHGSHNKSGSEMSDTMNMDTTGSMNPMGDMRNMADMSDMVNVEDMVHKTFPIPPAGPRVEMWRIGYDLSAEIGPVTIKHESVGGKNDDTWVGGTFLEFEYVVPKFQDLRFKAQTKIWSKDLENKEKMLVTLILGSELVTIQYLKFSIAWEMYVSPFKNNVLEARKLVAQIYYFGK